jgi:mannose-1-phosphate guanylyltransferase
VPGVPTALAVTEFVEKPDAQRAQAYVASGEYRWNAGMFISRASVLLDLLAEHHPEMAEGLRAIAAEPSTLESRWPGLTRIAIDHAVAEPAAAAGRVAVVPGPFGWEDVGDFASLAALTSPNDDGVRIVGDESLVLTSDASGLVLPAAGRTVAVVGLDDVVVVDTGDALLVTSYQRAQDVKAVVDELRRRGRTDLT